MATNECINFVNNNNNNNNNSSNVNIIEAGTDVTALIWKTLQSSQIQRQLDQSHNIYYNDDASAIEDEKMKFSCSGSKIEKIDNYNDNSNKKNIMNDNRKILTDEMFNYLSQYSDVIIRNIDDDSNSLNNTTTSTITGTTTNNNNKNVYFDRLHKLYLDNYSDYDCNDGSKKCKDKIKIAVRQQIFQLFLQTPLTPFNYSFSSSPSEPITGGATAKDYYEELINIKNFHTNINNFIDLRKNKKWVLYVLSDNVERYGTMQPHIIFNKMPGWLFDALQIAYKKNLFLKYSTDLRGVNEWLGQFCSLINLHNLLALNEINPTINYTALLLHLAGILSTSRLNPINRQGMLFSNNVLQKCTFENVKKLLTKARDKDDLSSFISSTLLCIPQKTGTNAFDLISSPAFVDS